MVENVRFSFMLVVLKHITNRSCTFHWILRCRNFACSDFPSTRLSPLKTWNFTSGWVKNHVKQETGDIWVVTCQRERIDNQTKEVRDYRDNPCQQPGNLSLFPRQNYQGKMWQQHAMCTWWHLTTQLSPVSLLARFWPNRKWNCTFSNGWNAVKENCYRENFFAFHITT